MSVRQTYVIRDGKLVPKSEAQPLPAHNGPYVMLDIAPFVTHGDNVPISSRSALREYERKTGTRQIGNDIRPPRLPGEYD